MNHGERNNTLLLLSLFFGKGLVAGFSILIFFCSLSLSAKAQHKPILPESIILDGKEYSDEQLLKAFVDAALHFPDGLQFPEDSTLLPPYSSTWPSFVEKEEFSRQYRWLFEYIYREQGSSEFYTLNKWLKPLSVAVGFPNNLKPFEISSGHQAYELVHSEQAEEIPKKYQKIIDAELGTLLQTVSQITSLETSYLKGKSAHGEYGNINIIFNSSEGGSPPFKARSAKASFVTGGRSPIHFRGRVERNLPAAVHFTEISKKQVDGFYLVNNQNEIELAFCFIWLGHDEALFRALIRECIVRSLGLPDAVGKENPSALLSLWNDPAAWRAPYYTNKLPQTPPKLSEFDQLLLRVLYNPRLRAGTSYVYLQHLLMGEKK